ncbi:hypothetical protein J4453_02090 [Candidatus Woesearchaeota archaeon]|nr:hypothetical protein [Candidatus Woesearchaeota archaeon]
MKSKKELRIKKLFSLAKATIPKISCRNFCNEPNRREKRILLYCVIRTNKEFLPIFPPEI